MIVYTGAANNFLIATDCIDCVPPEIENYSHEQFTWEDQAISIISARFASQMRLLDWVDGYTIQIGDTEINEEKETTEMITATEIRNALPTAEFNAIGGGIFCLSLNGVMIHPFNADGTARDIEVHITNVQNGDAIAHCTTIDEILDNVPPQSPVFTIETDGTHWAGRNERGDIEVVGYSEDDIMDYVRQHDILPYRVDYRPAGYSLGPS